MNTTLFLLIPPVNYYSLVKETRTQGLTLVIYMNGSSFMWQGDCVITRILRQLLFLLSAKHTIQKEREREPGGKFSQFIFSPHV
jgi:hypothetical protein